jgi:hypothetical protein
MHCFIDDGVDGVVSELVQQNFSEYVRLLLGALFLKNRVKDQLLSVKVAGLNQFFNHARAVFRIAIVEKVEADNFGDFSVDRGVFEEDDFADHIVCEFVVDELLDVANNFVDETALLQKATCFQTLLHHAAPLFIFGDPKAVCDDGLINWVLVFVFDHYVKTGLDNMVSVNVD